MKVKNLIEELSKHDPEALVTVELDKDFWDEGMKFDGIEEIRSETLHSLKTHMQNLPPEHYVVLALTPGKRFDEMTEEEKNQAFENYRNAPYVPEDEDVEKLT